MYDRFLDILLEASKKTPSQIKAARRKANLAAQGKTPGSMAAAASQAAQNVYRGTAKPRPQLGNNPTRAVATVTSRDVVPTTTKSVVPSVKKPAEVLPALRTPGALARIKPIIQGTGNRKPIKFNDPGEQDAIITTPSKPADNSNQAQKTSAASDKEVMRDKFKNKLRSLLSKGKDLTNISTPKSVY